MASGKKRKFNWDELSSEDEADVKKVAKKEEKKIVKKDEKKEDKKLIEDQVDKLSKLSVKSSIQESVEKEIDQNTPIKMRTSVKRELEFENDSSNKKIKTTNSPKIKQEEESIDELTAKNNRLSNAGDQTLTKSKLNKPIKSEKKNKDRMIDCKELNLPLINVKSIKMKILKPNSNKKFSKQHLNIQNSPTKLKSFTEIKIELNDEQRNWFKESIQKVDGDYDRDFDVESFMEKSSAIPGRKRRY